jgi:hypothetical protein
MNNKVSESDRKARIERYALKQLGITSCKQMHPEQLPYFMNHKIAYEFALGELDAELPELLKRYERFSRDYCDEYGSSDIDILVAEFLAAEKAK